VAPSSGLMAQRPRKFRDVKYSNLINITFFLNRNATGDMSNYLIVPVSTVINIDLYIIFTSSSGKHFISETKEYKDHLRMPIKEENLLLSGMNLNTTEKNV